MWNPSVSREPRNTELVLLWRIPGRVLCHCGFTTCIRARVRAHILENETPNTLILVSGVDGQTPLKPSQLRYVVPNLLPLYQIFKCCEYLYGAEESNWLCHVDMPPVLGVVSPCKHSQPLNGLSCQILLLHNKANLLPLLEPCSLGLEVQVNL